MRSRVIAGSLAEDMGRKGVIPIIRSRATRADKLPPISLGLQALWKKKCYLWARAERTQSKTILSYLYFSNEGQIDLL